jgi:hypothetical protein
MRDQSLSLELRASEKLLERIQPKTMLQAQVLLHMIPWLVIHRQQWVSYSRAQHGYPAWKKKYHGEFYTYRGVMAAVEYLERNGLIVNQVIPPGTHSVVRSRMQATHALVELMRGITIEHCPVERIVLKDSDGEVMDYAETDDIGDKRNRLNQVNAFLAGTELTLSDGATLNGGCYRRIFNRGNFASGGRLYGPQFQQQPKVERQSMLINGEPAVMLDYSSHHGRLLYNERQLIMPREPYAVEGFERPEGKIAFNTMLNAKTPWKAVQAIGTWMAERNNRKWPTSADLDRARDLYGAVAATHAPCRP